MTNAVRLAALFGVPAVAAVFVATLWLGGDREDADDGENATEIRDVLLTRDARLYEGRLDGCNASSCELEDRNYDRRTIGFIGLGVDSAMPPIVRDPSRDELHLRGSSSISEPLAQIDDDRVFAGARNFERAEVEWIYLAPEPAAPSAELAGDPEEPLPETDSSGAEYDSAGGTAPGSPAPRPARGPDPAFRGCPDDKPLGAWIWLKNDYQNSSPPTCRGTETQVVRFRLEPLPGAQHPDSAVALTYRATKLHYAVSTDGCFDVGGHSYLSCNAEGTFVEGTLSLSEENLGFAHFFPLVPALGFQYPAPPTWPFELTVRCPYQLGGVFETTAHGFTGVQISPGDCGYQHRECESYCVAPTECQTSNFGLPDCITHAERHAVIPFAGALVDGPERSQRGLCELDGSSQVRWDVCCGCAETGPPPDFAPRDGDCGPPNIQRALLDTALEQQKAILAPLGELLRKRQSIQNEANQWYNDFEHATRDCRLWSAARFLVGMLASGGAGVSVGGLRVGAQDVQQTKAFWNFLAWAEKVNSGDPSWLLPNHEFGDWVSVEDAWDAFIVGYGALGPSSPQSLREGLEQCGAPTIEGVLDGAYKYLGLIEQLPALGEGINEILNKARAKDQEIFDLWQKWQQACREHERCQGGDPSRCDTPPQSGPFQ